MKKDSKWNISVRDGKRIIWTTAGVSLAMAVPAMAGNNWVGDGTSANWSTVANWSGAVPAGGSPVTIGDTSAHQPAGTTVDLGTDYSDRWFSGMNIGTYGTGATPTAYTLNINSGGKLQLYGTVQSGNTSTSNYGGNGIINVQGGAFTLGDASNAGTLRVGGIFAGAGGGIVGRGTVNFSGGSFTINNNGASASSVQIGYASSSSAANGTMWVHAGLSNPLLLGRGSAAGSFIVGGVNTTSVSHTPLLKLGDASGNAGAIQETGTGAKGWAFSSGKLSDIAEIQGYGRIQMSEAGTIRGKVTGNNWGYTGAGVHPADVQLDLSGLTASNSVPQFEKLSTNPNNSGTYTGSHSYVTWQGVQNLTDAFIYLGGNNNNRGSRSLQINGVMERFATVTTLPRMVASTYSPDCFDSIPKGLRSAMNPMQVWSLNGNSSLSVSGNSYVDFTYDTVTAAGVNGRTESDLQLWQYNGTSWSQVAATPDTTNHFFQTPNLSAGDLAKLATTGQTLWYAVGFAGASNHAPVANITAPGGGSSYTYNTDETLPALGLTGGVSDQDNDLKTVAWSLLSGPAAVTFADASQASTSVQFTTAGLYELKLTGTDTEGVTGSAVLSVNVVVPEPGTIGLAALAAPAMLMRRRQRAR